MKINFFKRHLAFYLSTILISGNIPSFAVKRNPKEVEKKAQKCAEVADLLNNIFEVPEDQKSGFYIRRRKTGRKSDNLSIFSLIVPEIVQQNMGGIAPKCFEMNSLLPSMTNNPCATLYPFLVASLLQFAPYLLKPYQGGPRKSKATYYLSFAHIHLHDPRVALIYPYHLSMLTKNNNTGALRESIASILSNTYRDENGSWTGTELANMTIFLHSTKIYNSSQLVATDRICKMLSNENAGNRNILNMVDPLIDIVNNITDKSYKLNSEKPISKAYKSFYLDIVKAIDSDRANLFQLLDDNTVDTNTNIPQVNTNNLYTDTKLENKTDECEYKSNLEDKYISDKNRIKNKKRIRKVKRFRKVFKRLNKNRSVKEKNIINHTNALVPNNQLRRPVFVDKNIVFP